VGKVEGGEKMKDGRGRPTATKNGANGTCSESLDGSFIEPGFSASSADRAVGIYPGDDREPGGSIVE
jgi:hypothetical protein